MPEMADRETREEEEEEVFNQPEVGFEGPS